MIQRKKKLLNKDSQYAWSEGLTMVMQIGLTMVGCIAFCFFSGFYLDRWLGTKGVFITIFLIFGIFGGANTAYRQIMGMIPDCQDKQGKSE
ncbi:AtpZ/AtpI family protein [Desulfococcaceae bacterium HSG9]|nr:AtpZ/AtpI family protein [Desulfococcaceae bacterium HSG9]